MSEGECPTLVLCVWSNVVTTLQLHGSTLVKVSAVTAPSQPHREVLYSPLLSTG